MISQEELKRIAGELLWWQQPELSLSDPRRFLMQVMTLGSSKQVEAVREAFGAEAMRDALINAAPGVFDGKSWSYWHVMFDLPERPLPGGSLK
jgi:hypothetical protein